MRNFKIYSVPLIQNIVKGIEEVIKKRLISGLLSGKANGALSTLINKKAAFLNGAREVAEQSDNLRLRFSLSLSLALLPNGKKTFCLRSRAPGAG